MTLNASEWSAIGIDFPDDRLERRVARHAETKGDALAVWTPAKELSWRELDTAADGLAGWLADRGLSAGDRIGWLARNNAEFPVLLVAARRLRLVLAGYNWRLAAQELEAVLASAPPRLLVTDVDDTAPFASFPILKTGPDFWDAAASSTRIAYSEPGPDEPCTIIFTSGSTGAPKPVVYALRSFEERVCAPVALEFPDNTRLMIIAPQFHASGWIWTCYGLSGGWPQFLLPTADPASMLGAVETFRITHAQWLPTMLHLAVKEQRARPRDLSSLQFISYGASPITPQLLDDVTRDFNCRFSQVYGLTETMGAVAHLGPAAHLCDWGTAGPPTARTDPGVEIRIVDTEGRLLTTGTEGLIEARLDVEPPRYIDGETTRSVADSEGWIATNDIGRLDGDGYLWVVGRKGDMIITGGENVYPVEVENMMAENPAIDQVAVFGVADPLWGQKIVAAVVRRPGSDLSEDALHAWCRARMTHYKVPKAILFVNALPRNAMGKLVRTALPALTAEHA